MTAVQEEIRELTTREYEYGFVTEIEAEAIPPGLNEEIIRLISAKNNEPSFMLQWRLKSYRHWLTMKEPTWQNVRCPPSTTRPSSTTPPPQQSGRVGPEAPRDVREARDPVAGAGEAGRSGGWAPGEDA